MFFNALDAIAKKSVAQNVAERHQNRYLSIIYQPNITMILHRRNALRLSLTILALLRAATPIEANNILPDERERERERLSEREQQIVKKPNIILILADDVGTGDIPSYWNSSAVHMPNIDRLAKMGVTFKDAHSTPLCAPSRYMVLSGNYAHRGMRVKGSWNLRSNENQFRDSQRSIAQVLRDDAGYHTGMFGKWHLGVRAPSTTGEQLVTADTDMARILSDGDFDWRLPLGQGPQDIGFNTSYITIGGIQAPPYSFFQDGYLTTKVSEVTYWEPNITYDMPHGSSIVEKGGEGDPNWDSTAYNMILVNKTKQHIDNHLNTNPSQPFFTYVALGGVHVPHTPPNAYIDHSPVKHEYPTTHMDLLFEMDKAVGSLVSHIEDLNIANETMIIFTSDNGGLSNSEGVPGHKTSGPFRGIKNSIYEGGHRVPLMIRYDGKFPANEGRNEIIGLNDLYATICELVGVNVPFGSAQDSISFARYIRSERKYEGMRNTLGTWTYGKTKSGMMNNNAAIRFGPMKLIHKMDESNFELYDLKNDLSEQVDLSKDPKYSLLIQEMHKKMKADGPCPGDSEEKFFIQGLNQVKGCGWFRKWPGGTEVNTKKCNNYIEGQLHCASVCAFHKEFCDKMAIAQGKIFSNSIAVNTDVNTITSEEDVHASHGPWSYIVLADWHGAESFAVKPVSSLPTDSTFFNGALKVIEHIHTNYGGDLVFMPGDSNSGKWDSNSFKEKLNRELGTSYTEVEDVIAVAGANCYSTIKYLFSQGGYDDLLFCLGDHELGDNPWKYGSQKLLRGVPEYRDSVAQKLLSDSTGSHLFDAPIGNGGLTAPSRPIGTVFEHSSYTHVHKNALFITLDAFHDTNTPGNFFDRPNGSGGEGSITCTVTGDHLTWLENVLIAANGTSEIKHIFVQAHVPILQPVRKINCSGQYLDRAKASDLWILMIKYNVDVYFAGEVHALTASKDPDSNLLQIVSRGNRLNNFLSVNIPDDEKFTVTAYNEVGDECKWNANYTPYGKLTVDKSGSETTIEASGALALLDNTNTSFPLIRFSFDEKSLHDIIDRPVVGMKYDQYTQMLYGYTKTIREEVCKKQMQNFGVFGQSYDAQVANLDFVPGMQGSDAAVFNPTSRVAIYSFGPLGSGEALSCAMFFKTNETATSEMILVSYASNFSPANPDVSSDFRKDVFLLTLKDGNPVVYTSTKKYLLPIEDQALNDGVWHHIAVTMPSKSCLLSEVIIYVDGVSIATTAPQDDDHIFYATTGTLSIGGWGYSHPNFDRFFPSAKEYIGIMDNFRFYARSMNDYDLGLSIQKKFEKNLDVRCQSGNNIPIEIVGQIGVKKCQSLCSNKPNCWAFEIRKTPMGKSKCVHYAKRPPLGVSQTGAQCNPVIS